MTNPFGGAHDHEVDAAANRGDWNAGVEQSRRMAGREIAAGRSGDGARASDGTFGIALVFAAIGVAIYVLVSAVSTGVTALANESLLSPLFPRAGDSVARFVVSLLTLIAVVPGSLVLAARALRGTRLHALRRFVLFPLAIIMTPALAAMAVATTQADAVRLIS